MASRSGYPSVEKCFSEPSIRIPFLRTMPATMIVPMNEDMSRLVRVRKRAGKAPEPHRMVAARIANGCEKDRNSKTRMIKISRMEAGALPDGGLQFRDVPYGQARAPGLLQIHPETDGGPDDEGPVYDIEDPGDGRELLFDARGHFLVGRLIPVIDHDLDRLQQTGEVSDHVFQDMRELDFYGGHGKHALPLCQDSSVLLRCEVISFLMEDRTRAAPLGPRAELPEVLFTKQNPVVMPRLGSSHISFRCRLPFGRRSYLRVRGFVNTAALPSSAAISSRRLYFAMRSLRQAEPVLIWPPPIATAKSAMNVSSVSPERCEIT